jgi:hypothetical protein
MSTRIKGPWFPSHDRQHETSSKKKLVWLPNVQSTRQKKKNLRLKARRIIDSTDPQTIAVGDRVIRSVCEEPDPEYSALHLFCAALDVSDETGEPWTVCMTYLMDKFEGKVPPSAPKDANAEENQPKSERNQGGAFLRRLLRTLTPRAFRASDAVSAETNVHQPVSLSDSEHGDQSRADSAGSDSQSVGTSQDSDPRRI